MKAIKDRKKKKRDKRLKSQRHQRSIRDAYLKKYPNLIVKHHYASIDLIHEIEGVCHQIDFRNCDKEIKEMLIDHKNLVSKKFINKYSQKPEEIINEEDHFNFSAVATEEYCEYVPYIELENIILILIYKCLEESGAWSRFMPIHNIIVRSYRGDFLIFANGFHQHHSSFGKGYYTEKHVYVELPNEDGKIKKYRVAMSMHALKRIFERTFRCSLEEDLNKAQYPLFLYQFGLYSECRSVKMSDGWAVAIYATYHHGPDMPHSLAHKISYELLGRMDEFKMLCGYCPIGFCKDEFVHLKTLLSPGMRGTPEEKLIQSIKDRKQREKFERMVSDIQFTDEHMEVLKFFQNSGYHVVEYLSEEEKKNA